MFQKGKQKTGGRAKGTPNTVTRDLREALRGIVEGNLEQIAKDLEGLEPRERVAAWLKLTEFVLPKLNRIEQETKTAGEPTKTIVIYIDSEEQPGPGLPNH